MVGWSHAQGGPVTVDRGSHTCCGLEGATTYRFVNMMEDGDRMSAVFRNSATPLVVGVDEGAQHAPERILERGWVDAGVVPLVPGAGGRQYATIGLTGPASLSGLGNDRPSTGQTMHNLVQAFFASDGAEELRADSEIGTVWFVVNDAPNALPDESMRVLILQITTTGTVDGTLNFQVLPEGPWGWGQTKCARCPLMAGVYYDPEFGPVFGCRTRRRATSTNCKRRRRVLRAA